jgi:hypothetical protein
MYKQVHRGFGVCRILTELEFGKEISVKSCSITFDQNMTHDSQVFAEI